MMIMYAHMLIQSCVYLYKCIRARMYVEGGAYLLLLLLLGEAVVLTHCHAYADQRVDRLLLLLCTRAVAPYGWDVGTA